MQTKWWSVQIMQLLCCKINLHDIRFRNSQPAIQTLYYGAWALMLIRSAKLKRHATDDSVAALFPRLPMAFFPACSCSHPPLCRIVLTISFFLFFSLLFLFFPFSLFFSLFSYLPFFACSFILFFFFQAMLYFLQQTHSDIVTYYPTSTFSTPIVRSSHLYSAFIFAFLMHYLLHLKYEISEETATSWNEISTTPIRIINF